jgi:hypothetical protein
MFSVEENNSAVGLGSDFNFIMSLLRLLVFFFLQALYFKGFYWVNWSVLMLCSFCVCFTAGYWGLRGLYFVSFYRLGCCCCARIC